MMMFIKKSKKAKITKYLYFFFFFFVYYFQNIITNQSREVSKKLKQNNYLCKKRNKTKRKDTCISRTQIA